jgi:hypothetical protein
MVGEVMGTIIGLYMLLKGFTNSWVQWLMPVIASTWEAEIRRIAVCSQPG